MRIGHVRSRPTLVRTWTKRVWLYSLKEGSQKLTGNIKIVYSGAIAEDEGILEDAQRTANEMPAKLMLHMNTLKYSKRTMKLSWRSKKSSQVQCSKEAFRRYQEQISDFQNASSSCEDEFTALI